MVDIVVVVALLVEKCGIYFVAHNSGGCYCSGARYGIIMWLITMEGVTVAVLMVWCGAFWW